MGEVIVLSRQIDFNNLIYYFKSESINPINFVSFKDPLHLYKDIFNGNIKPAKREEAQNNSYQM